MVLTGFRAAAEFIDKLPDDYVRLEKSDWDVICTMEEFKDLYASFGDDVLSAEPSFPTKYFIKTSKGNYDISILNDDTSSNADIYNYVNRFPVDPVEDKFGNSFSPANLKLSYLIKKSHLFIRKNFKKHMQDVWRYSHNIQRTWGLFNSYENDIYKKRLQETLKRAEKQTAHINLNQSKDDFFNTKGVSYTLDHDDIHESVKLMTTPAYLDILVPGEDVLCSEELFNSLPFDRQLNCVAEEACVIGIERFLSKGKDISPHEAYSIGLEKICTTLCKGWFRKFACKHYMEALERYPDDYYDRFKEALEAGRIKKYTKLDER